MKIFRRSVIHYLLNRSALLRMNLFLHVWSALNVKLQIPHLNAQILPLLQILQLPLLSLISRLRTLLVSLMMQGWRNCTSQTCTKASKGIRLFVMCLKSRSSTGTLGKRVLPLRGNSMLMVHIGSLSPCRSARLNEVGVDSHLTDSWTHPPTCATRKRNSKKISDSRGMWRIWNISSIWTFRWRISRFTFNALQAWRNKFSLRCADLLSK